GITGSMVVGNDGIVIAADLDESFESETIGALAASITTNIQKSLDRLQTTPLKQVTIEADEGKLFFTDAEMGILVVTTEKNINIGLVRLEIKNAITKLKVNV
ncbi:roadblock/LC7 domain-containing protein, partial [Candidatus Zixiibacteriota bacterium]